MQSQPINYFTLSCKNAEAFFESIGNMQKMNNGEAFIFSLNIEALKNQQDYLSQLLNFDELNQVHQFKKPTDQLTKLISRAVLKQLISKLKNIPIDLINIQRDDFGKPFLANQIDTPLNFSLSDSHEHVLIALSVSNIGIDIEKVVDFTTSEIVSAHFSVEEKFLYATVPNSADFFFTIWTRKESILKASGIGLTDLMNTLNVTDGICWDLPFYLSLKDNWSITSYNINEIYKASIAVPQSTRRLFFYDYLTVNPPFF